MNNKKNILLISAIILMGIMAGISCTHPTQAEPVPSVSFNTDIIPILTSYCTINGNCHLGANSTNQFTNFDSDSAYYTLFEKKLINTSNPSASLFYAELVEQQMPLAPYAPLSAANQQLILEWIKQGAKNN